MKDARVFVAGTVAHLLNVSVAGDPMFGNSSCRYGHSVSLSFWSRLILFSSMSGKCNSHRPERRT